MDENNVFDKIVCKEKVVTEKDGTKLVEEQKFIICSVCGHANDITASQCEQCSNYLTHKN